MLQLLEPIWLWLAAGTLIPLMIHLWNIRPGKPLTVGSIALLKENGRQSSRRWQLADWLLLLLRCLLIVLLALLLAKPTWRTAAIPKEKGWLLMDKDKLQETYRHFQPQIDTLLKAGYTFHYFMTGFPEEDLKTALQDAEGDSADSSSYWALLDSLQQHPHAPAKLFLFTPHYLHRFHGTRPHIDTSTHWYVYMPADSVSTWQAEAYATASGSIRTRKVTSRAAGNSYLYEELPASAADSATKQITIFADTYAHDAGYLKAALNAIQQFTDRKIKVSLISQTLALPQQTDWLFWLSMQPLPAEVKAANIWRYDSGAVLNRSSWILAATAPPVPLFKRIQEQVPIAALPLWKDGFGNVVLYLRKKNNGNIYHFSSRLDPAWNELPWSGAFPGLLLELLYPDSSRIPSGKDRRAIAAQQLQPDTYGAMPSYKRKVLPASDLTPVLWMAVFALFLAERIWVFRTKKIIANG